MNDDHFLTTEEVLDYLQVNLRTIYRLIKAGKIPAVRVGRQWRFRKHDIDAWLNSNRSNSRSGVMDRPRILIVDDEQTVRDLVAKKPDAIIFNPNGPDVLNPALAEANAAGIKTVALDAYVTDPNTLNISNDQVAYGYVERHVGPRETVGNKGGSLSNRLRAAMKA